MPHDARPGFVAVPPPHRPCPICAAPVHAEARYPGKVCIACAKRTVDETGRPLAFANESLSGGFVASYADTGDPYPAHGESFSEVEPTSGRRRLERFRVTGPPAT